MLWKICKRENLPDWADKNAYSKNNLFIYVKYPWVKKQAYCPLTWNNFVVTMKTVYNHRKYCR